MSRSTALFIDSPDSLEDLAHQLAEVTHASVAPSPRPDAWEVRLGEVTATLASYQDASDGLAFLNRYRFALAASMTEGCTAADSPEVRALRDVARTLRESTTLASLLVLDVQNRMTPVVAAEPVSLDWSAVGS